jgi:uncharacterized RDD family membrane protein YckC
VSTPNNYAPPQSVVADISSSTAAFEKATRLSRLGAVLLDGLIFTVPFIPCYATAFRTVVATHSPAQNYFAFWTAMASSGPWFYLASLINLALLAVTIVFVYKNGQTIGKKIVGIKVARTDGSRASLARIFWMRNVLNAVISIVPLIGPFYSLIDICMIFGGQRRCCHDYIADTIVIRA